MENWDIVKNSLPDITTSISPHHSATSDNNGGLEHVSSGASPFCKTGEASDELQKKEGMSATPPEEFCESLYTTDPEIDLMNESFYIDEIGRAHV